MIGRALYTRVEFGWSLLYKTSMWLNIVLSASRAVYQLDLAITAHLTVGTKLYATALGDNSLRHNYPATEVCYYRARAS